MEFRILDAGPARPCCVEKDSRMFLTRLKSTSTGNPASSSSCVFAPDKSSCVCRFPCDVRSSACEALCDDEKKGANIVFTQCNHSWWREPLLTCTMSPSNTSPNLAAVQGREGLGFRVRVAQLSFWTCMPHAPADTKCLFLGARFQSTPIWNTTIA